MPASGPTSPEWLADSGSSSRMGLGVRIVLPRRGKSAECAGWTWAELAERNCCQASSVSHFQPAGWLGTDSGDATRESSATSAGPSALSRGQLWAAWNQLRGDAYPLDTLARSLDVGEKIVCDARPLIAYKGSSLRYRGTVWINPAFRERLERFEDLVRDVALKIYGRVPQRLDHLGAYNCRSTRHHVGRLSEHALRNALDVAGFEFAPAPKRLDFSGGESGAKARADAGKGSGGRFDRRPKARRGEFRHPGPRCRLTAACPSSRR